MARETWILVETSCCFSRSFLFPFSLCLSFLLCVLFSVGPLVQQVW